MPPSATARVPSGGLEVLALFEVVCRNELVQIGIPEQVGGGVDGLGAVTDLDLEVVEFVGLGRHGEPLAARRHAVIVRGKVRESASLIMSPVCTSPRGCLAHSSSVT